MSERKTFEQVYQDGIEYKNSLQNHINNYRLLIENLELNIWTAYKVRPIKRFFENRRLLAMKADAYDVQHELRSMSVCLANAKKRYERGLK